MFVIEESEHSEFVTGGESSDRMAGFWIAKGLADNMVRHADLIEYKPYHPAR